MADFPDICASNYNFTLLYNTQGYESPLTKSVQTASLTGDQWRCTATYTNKYGADARTLRAFILGLKGQVGRFNYTPPDLNQGGTLLGTPVIDGAGQLGDSINTKGWDYPQPELILAGDYLTVNGELKIVTGDASSYSIVSYPDATNLMPSPFDPSGWAAASDPDGTIANVTLDNPSGESFAGLAEQVGASFFTINTTPSPAVSINRGEIAALAIIAKDIDVPSGLEFFFDFTSTQDASVRLRIADGSLIFGTGGVAITRFTQLSDGYSLIEVKHEGLSDDTIRSRFTLFDDAGSIPPAGTQIYAQSTFSGKNPLEYPYAQYNEFEDAAEASEWTPTRCNISVGGGFLSMVGTGADMYIINANPISFDGGKYSRIVTRWRRNSGSVSNGLFWGNVSNPSFNSTNSIGFDEAGTDPRVTIEGPDIDGFYTSTIDLSGTGSWTGSEGNVTGLRFDYGQNLPSDFDIDYIKIYSPSLLAVYDAWWPANVDGVATIPIAPPLRQSPPDLSPLEVEKPYMTAKLEDDEQTAFQVSSPVIYNASFSIVEVF